MARLAAGGSGSEVGQPAAAGRGCRPSQRLDPVGVVAAGHRQQIAEAGQVAETGRHLADAGLEILDQVGGRELAAAAGTASSGKKAGRKQGKRWQLGKASQEHKSPAVKGSRPKRDHR